MSDWRAVSIGQIATYRKGIAYSAEDYGQGQSGHPFITIKCFVKGGGYEATGIKFYEGVSTKRDHLAAGDVLFAATDLTRAGDIVGSPLRVPDFCSAKPPVASMDCVRIDPACDECDKDFLFHLLMLPDVRRQMIALSAGSTVLHLDTKRVADIRLRIPEKTSAQRRIAKVLESVDHAIEATEALIEKHQHIRAGLMHDLFTRGLIPDGLLRPVPSKAPELYCDTPLGKVPVGWEVAGLSSRQRSGTKWIRTGPFGSSLKGEHWVTEGHPVITIGALGEGEFLQSELLYVGPRDAERLREFQLFEGDVVFSRVADVGRSAVIRGDNASWIMSSNLMRIAVDAGRARPDYLQMALASDSRIKSQIRAKVNSGGREVANSEVLSQLLFAWPPPDEQDRIVELGLLAGSRIRAFHSTVRKLRAQKRGLMQDLLTGKVAVKVPEPAIPA